MLRALLRARLAACAAGEDESRKQYPGIAIYCLSFIVAAACMICFLVFYELEIVTAVEVCDVGVHVIYDCLQE